MRSLAHPSREQTRARRTYCRRRHFRTASRRLTPHVTSNPSSADGPDSLATLLSPELIELGLLQVEDDLKAEGLPIDDLKPVVRRYDMSMAGLDEAWEFRSKKRKRFSVTRAQGDQYYVFWGVR